MILMISGWICKGYTIKDAERAAHIRNRDIVRIPCHFLRSGCFFIDKLMKR
jgi:hypothetical protein